jgi:hypothetical protein
VRRFPGWLVLLLVPVVVAAVVLFGPAARSDDRPVLRAASASPLAADVLATLPVKGRAPKAGYARSAFGPAWADVDRNGCDTRNDILQRDLTERTVRPGTHGCVVLSGVLADRYTGAVIHFAKARASAVQIDHVVALSDAWQKGAHSLTPTRRQQLANDPLNLLAVDGRANQQKGDGDAATWLPPNKAFRCTYVARQVAVKAAYGLWVTGAERDAMVRILRRCPSQGLPALAALPAAPATSSTSTPATTGAPYYASCDAARRAGAAPLQRSDPGYRPALDGDRDGVACE